MNRRSAKVILLHREASSMVDDWIDHIELRRDAHATFAVWGNKYGQDPMTGRRRWFDWDKTKGLKSPMAIHKAIKDFSESLSVEVEWDEAIPLIALIDWVTASVIANRLGYSIPSLPDANVLLSERSLRALGHVTVGAEWGYDMHELTLPFERWVRILRGDRWSIKKPYAYEGERFTGDWAFDGRGGLIVAYDGGGTGWEGELESLDLIEGPKLDDVDLAMLALRAVTRDEL